MTVNARLRQIHCWLAASSGRAASEVGQQQVSDRSEEGTLTQREDEERLGKRVRDTKKRRVARREEVKRRGGVYSLTHKLRTSSDSAQLLALLCFAWGCDKWNKLSVPDLMRGI